MSTVQLSLFDHLYDHPESKQEDDMIVKALQMGSGYQNGKKRICEFVLSNPSIEKLSKFLKDEYGVGGRGTPCRDPYTIHNEQHDGSGIRIKWIDANGRDNEADITWSKAAEIIQSLVKQDSYN